MTTTATKNITLQDIKAPIAGELHEFEQRFRASMKSDVPLLDRITRFLVKRKGKQMRPMFVFLSAKLNGHVTDGTYVAASLVELLHTATLVHDDVVDDAHQRRGFFSINALWKNKIAVLIGDYLLSRGLLLSLENNHYHLLQIVSEAVRQMSEGELLQIEKTRRLNIKEETYYKIIRKKTASLIAACCASGAASAGADKGVVQQMRDFGEKVGMAFQIKDDLLDFSNDDTGKPKGGDIKEKKLTLPLIYALNNTSRSVRNRIINTVKNHERDKKRVKEVITWVQKSGGVEHADKIMHRYRKEALDILQQIPLNDSRQALENLVHYTTARKR